MPWHQIAGTTLVSKEQDYIRHHSSVKSASNFGTASPELNTDHFFRRALESDHSYCPTDTLWQIHNLSRYPGYPHKLVMDHNFQVTPVPVRASDTPFPITSIALEQDFKKLMIVQPVRYLSLKVSVSRKLSLSVKEATQHNVVICQTIRNPHLIKVSQETWKREH